eukprot:TRINITY_DN74804_c0_g1_i1.p1 TRINITY_DN74804_c0_g1~~TRINITY_DN74804_c0_g1_i1.p1  ORF type:complete len:385 (+),score=170.79 TRINITY_DN74804_c0_g1_i1:129-1283(+)
MSSYKLSEVEAQRAQVLLEEALRKLHFLTSISTTGSGHGDNELTQFMGEQISRIIQEQRDLEKRYEELIAARGQLKGLCNRDNFKRTQKDIQGVAHSLRESNKNLCRNLKENPNVQGNLLKMAAERSQVQEWFEETKSDLIEYSFANLVAKVEAERREQERLNEVKKKEKEATQTVKQLEAELQREYADNEKETKKANQEIKELKEDLQKHRTISDIEYKFEEKKLRAQEQALLRIHAQMEKKLVEELEELQRAQSMEQTVHEAAHTFLEDKVQRLQVQREQWTKDSEHEINFREVELTLLRERRTNGMLDFNELDQKRQLEEKEHKAKELEMRNAVLIHKQRDEQMARMAEAVLFLQEEGRRYMERAAARKAAQKGKKKGKKK